MISDTVKCSQGSCTHVTAAKNLTFNVVSSEGRAGLQAEHFWQNLTAVELSGENTNVVVSTVNFECATCVYCLRRTIYCLSTGGEEPGFDLTKHLLVTTKNEDTFQYLKRN